MAHAWLPQQINIARKQQNPNIYFFGFLDAKLKNLGEDKKTKLGLCTNS